MKRLLSVVATAAVVVGTASSWAGSAQPAAGARALRPATATAAATSAVLSWPLLSVGSAGDNVLAAKYLMRAKGYDTYLDRTYRSRFASQVGDFQSHHGLTVTGRVGQPTWSALFVTISYGSGRYNVVRALQVELRKVGYGVAVSGDFGARTLADVRDFQSRTGLTVDGVVGPATWSTLVRSSIPAKVVTKGTTTDKVVALTFDAGSDLGHTEQILSILAANGIKATFGFTGKWVQAYPAAAKQIVAAGHEVVNHTYAHESFTGFSTNTAPLTFSQRRTEIEHGWSVINGTTGERYNGWFRPPYGDRDPGVDRDVSAIGYPRELMWTVDSLGWDGLAPDKVVARVVAAATPGEIVLMHVGSDSTDAAALPGIIARLKALGYGFRTVDGVMR